MTRYFKFTVPGLLLVLFISGCQTGPTANGSFDRTLNVTSPIRLELSDGSGVVRISAGAAGQVRVHAEVHAHGWLFQDGQKQLNEIISNPPIEQRLDSIRIGKDLNGLHDVSIDYTVEVPDTTEVDASVAAGSVVVSNLHGPVKLTSASGAVRVEHVDQSVQINSASGSVVASNLSDDLRVSSASGSISASSIKGDIRIRALSGSIDVANPGGRVEAETASGTVNIQGANNDVKADSASGAISVQGNPSRDAYWSLKTASGSVTIVVPPSAAFHFTAEAVSGEIRTSLPIVVEEQGRHALRARLGSGGGRVEVHTVSGEIDVRSSS
jgi:DUF4097 and DUF4098 domain-containing protein YvlB